MPEDYIIRCHVRPDNARPLTGSFSFGQFGAWLVEVGTINLDGFSPNIGEGGWGVTIGAINMTSPTDGYVDVTVSPPSDFNRNNKPFIVTVFSNIFAYSVGGEDRYHIFVGYARRPLKATANDAVGFFYKKTDLSFHSGLVKNPADTVLNNNAASWAWRITPADPSRQDAEKLFATQDISFQFQKSGATIPTPEEDEVFPNPRISGLYNLFLTITDSVGREAVLEQPTGFGNSIRGYISVMVYNYRPFAFIERIEVGEGFELNAGYSVDLNDPVIRSELAGLLFDTSEFVDLWPEVEASNAINGDPLTYEWSVYASQEEADQGGGDVISTTESIQADEESGLPTSPEGFSYFRLKATDGEGFSGFSAIGLLLLRDTIFGAFIDAMGVRHSAVNEDNGVRISRFPNGAASRELLALIPNAKNASYKYERTKGIHLLSYESRTTGEHVLTTSRDGGRNFA